MKKPTKKVVTNVKTSPKKTITNKAKKPVAKKAAVKRPLKKAK